MTPWWRGSGVRCGAGGWPTPTSLPGPRESASCFLKTLEEPPPRSVLVLVGSSPDRQLPTIVSRCQVIRFAPLAPDLVAELLRAQGVDDAARVDRLARLSGGSPGMAQVLA